MNEYRAIKSIHIGKGIIIKGRRIENHQIVMGDKIPTNKVTDKQLESWMKRGLVERVTVTTKTSNPVDDKPADVEMSLNTAISDVDFVGKESANKLSEVGINVIADLEGWEHDDLIAVESIGKSKAKRLIELYESMNED